ncbi:alpha/beta fold hydrolase [Plantactinospora soyae]|uniref:Pimeloyl-ACP methyl ester carboxylesterase n=1 Tax=Plantactinospora soyae TaxID=1544732 RepID=A0A927R9B3_9ACTN|nr:alpha/beta hydrolase [Plantactinospora soyae]MBE1491264.1 pimeloyl-ACP methyl ester carboxylesterase [Plantactinospora soyae]
MTLAHDVEGDGPAVLLLHSSVCDRRMWDPQWSALRDAGYRVLRCDLRGYGQTPMADRPYTDAEDVRDLLDALRIDRVVLVAASYGGLVGLEVAARWPDRVSTLALLCPGMPGHQPSAELRAFGAREDALLEADDLTGAVELNVQTWLGPEADDATRDRVRQMQRHAFEVQLAATEEFPKPERDEIDLGKISAPCLAVSGRYDLPDFRQIAARLTELLPDARHLELPWAGHLPSLERPAEVTALLTDHLRETSPS